MLCSWEARFLYIRSCIFIFLKEAQSIQRESNGRTYIPINTRGSKALSANICIQASNMKHDIEFLYNITCARWQSSYTLLWSRPSAHRCKYINSIKCSVSLLRIFQIAKGHYGASDYFTSLTVTLTCSFPVFDHLGYST